MLDSVAYRDAEREEDYLGDGKEGGAKDNVADRPSILEGAENKDEL